MYSLWHGEPQFGLCLCFCIARMPLLAFLPPFLVRVDLHKSHILRPLLVPPPLVGKLPVPPARAPQGLEIQTPRNKTGTAKHAMSGTTPEAVASKVCPHNAEMAARSLIRLVRGLLPCLPTRSLPTPLASLC